MNCHKHDAVDATHECSKCHCAWCDHCLRIPRNAPHARICPSCRDLAVPVRQNAPRQSFATDVLNAVVYPMRGSGILIIVLGAMFLAIAAALSWVPILGWLMVVISTGYMAAYYSRVVSSSADGDDALPPWLEVYDWVEDTVFPFFRVVGVALLAALPMLSAVYLANTGFLSTQLAGVLALMLGGAALLFYLPIAWMAVSVHETIRAASPFVVLDVIRKVPLRAAVASVACVGTVGLTSAVQFVLGGNVLGVAVGYLIGLYGMFVAMRILGLLYFHSAEELNWFGERRRARAGRLQLA